jgi:phage internal scaffolding protein
MTKPKILTAFDRNRSTLKFKKPSMTKQSFRDEVNINNIMKKYEKTGLLTHVKQYGGKYADLADSSDYHTSMNIILEAQEAFDTLPSKVRHEFYNDPAKFLEFVQDPANAEKMIEMGLAERPFDQNKLSKDLPDASGINTLGKETKASDSSQS